MALWKEHKAANGVGASTSSTTEEITEVVEESDD